MLVLQRGKETPDGTHGCLQAQGQTVCYTLERPWLDNQEGISCIPPGVYQCIKHNSSKFPDVWEVTGVKDRQAILIHAGNVAIRDSHGCILVGLGIMLGGITQSQAALTKLRNLFPGGFTLEIRNS